MRILILDGDTAYSAKLSDRLQKTGHDVTAVSIPMEALIAIHDKGAPELLIMEMKLPAVSGYDFIQQLRRDKAFPVVILSEYGRDEDLNLAYSLGVFDYILKNSGYETSVVRVEADIVAIEEINKLTALNAEQKVNLARLSLEKLLKHLKMTYKSAEMAFERNKAKIITDSGDVCFASVGNIEGEAALYYLINHAKGEFLYRKRTGLCLNKNVETDIFERLIYYKELNSKFDKTLTMIPFKRRNSVIDSSDMRKQYYFNLIDNRSSVAELAEQGKLEEWLAVYYFTLLEKQHIIKLIDRDGIPKALYPPVRHSAEGINVLYAGKPPMSLKEKGEIKSIQEIRAEDDTLAKIKEFKPDVIVWDAAASKKINLKLLKFRS